MITTKDVTNLSAFVSYTGGPKTTVAIWDDMFTNSDIGGCVVNRCELKTIEVLTGPNDSGYRGIQSNTRSGKTC